MTGPLVKDLEADGSATFHFIHGDIDTAPPPGFEDYFGNPPHVRFLDYEGTNSESVLLMKLREFQNLDSAEESMRDLIPAEHLPPASSISRMLARLYRIMEDEGPFQGVIGYSEGASVAATLLIDNQKKCASAGSSNPLQHAIFFAGWPPVAPEGHTLLLPSQVGQVITANTVHVLGAADPYLHGCMALYGICDETTAHIFDHGKGHIVVRDARTVKELSRLVRERMSTPMKEGV